MILPTYKTDKRNIISPKYKETQIGIFPTEWKETTLGKIYTERKEPGNKNLPLLMVSIHSGVSDGEISEEDLPKKVKRIEDKSQYKRAAKGDLVFNMMRAWQGAIGTVRTEGMVSPAYIVAKPNDTVDPLFMDYYMKTNRMINTIYRQSYGVTDFRLRLYWDSFAPISCILPSIEEQKKIAEILSTQDKVIELKEKRLAEKQRQKKYLMQQLLTGKKRLSGFDGKWEKINFSNCFEFLSGYPFSSTYFNEDTGVRVIRNRDLKCDDQIIYTTEVCPIEYHIKDGDMLVGMDGEFVPCIWEKGNALLNQRVGKIIVSDKFDEKFIYYALFDPLQRLQNTKGATTVKHLASKDFRKMHCLIPCEYREQAAIGSILSAVDHEIELLYKSLELEFCKKKALMQLLLTGIVRV